MSSHAHVTGQWHDLYKLSPDGPLFQHSNLLIYLPVPITRCTSPCALDLLLQSIYKMQTSPSHTRGVSVCPARAVTGGPTPPSGKKQGMA